MALTLLFSSRSRASLNGIKVSSLTAHTKVSELKSHERGGYFCVLDEQTKRKGGCERDGRRDLERIESKSEMYVQCDVFAGPNI